MEEDIKVLENIIYNDQGKKMSYVDVDYAEGEKFINAIENLIKGYKELEEKVNKYEKQIDLEWVEENYIEKSKVRKKIEQIKMNANYDWLYKYDYQDVTKILEELLQEGDDN